MSEKRSSDVLGGLPNSRPHRRSAKRGARPSEGGQSGKPAAAKPAAAKPAAAKPRVTAATKKSTTPAKRAPAKASVARPSGAKAAPVKASAAKPTPVTRRKPARLQQPKQPSGVPAVTRPTERERAREHDLLGTAVQAAAELAEIGLTVGVRALRRAASRLPRP